MNSYHLSIARINSVIHLLLFVPWNIIVVIIAKKGDYMGYMTAGEAAKKWKISQRRVQILCSENRIEGIFKLGENWAIPDTAEKPSDKRLKVNKEENK